MKIYAIDLDKVLSNWVNETPELKGFSTGDQSLYEAVKISQWSGELQNYRVADQFSCFSGVNLSNLLNSGDEALIAVQKLGNRLKVQIDGVAGGL